MRRGGGGGGGGRIEVHHARQNVPRGDQVAGGPQDLGSGGIGIGTVGSLGISELRLPHESSIQELHKARQVRSAVQRISTAFH
jgi:hypothetical protein